MPAQAGLLLKINEFYYDINIETKIREGVKPKLKSNHFFRHACLLYLVYKIQEASTSDPALVDGNVAGASQGSIRHPGEVLRMTPPRAS
ncbi:MAG: hypothetical protein ACQEQX_01300 [Thermodesulfobacteriota bacterium]